MLQPAYRLSRDLGVDVKVVTRVYQRLQEALFHLTELEGGKLKGEIELDEAYFEGWRKGKRGSGSGGEKRRIWAPGMREPSLHQSGETVSAEELMRAIQAKTQKGSIYYTDGFRGYQFLKR